jgi:two-component sensor histidine kinase
LLVRFAAKRRCFDSERNVRACKRRIVGNTFTVGWTEREGPPVSPPQRRGLGTIVMEQIAERSVDGTVGLDYVTSGVTCPAANALSAGSDRD